MNWIELFAGGGAVGTGLLQAGHQVEVAIELDAQIAACYQQNHPTTDVIVSDIRDVNPRMLPSSINALWASPVCKQHSEARNKTLPPREDADIGVAILPYVRAMQPELIIIENVKGYLRHPSFTSIISTLINTYKYTISMKVLDAANYGIPQHRERLIVQARHGPIAWPEQVARPVSWYSALEDMLGELEQVDLAPWQRKLWKPDYERLVPVLVHSQYDNRTANEPRALSLVPSDRPSMTVTASHNSTQKRIVLSTEDIRRMSVRASARLQTFPDRYRFPQSTTRTSEIIGNAVPCLLTQKLAESYNDRSEAAV